MIRMAPVSGFRGMIAALTVLALSGCNDEGYLFFQEIVPGKVSDVTHKLKQLQGNPVVDILWVIDNSGSMYNHQQNVISNTALFMSQFVQASSGNTLNWKMGLVSTDKSDRPFVGFTVGDELSSSTPGNVANFQAAVNRLGTSGTYLEEGFDPLLGALRGFPNFVRPNSTLAVIFVTDAQEQGGMSVPDVLAELSKFKAISSTVSYGIFWTADLGCGKNPGEGDWNLSGSRYGEFIQATSGKTYPLCARDFGKNLADLGKDLVSRITAPKLFLESRPRVSTLKVLYQGVELKAGLPGRGGVWYYASELNAIVFHDLTFAPGDDEEVQVIYEEDTGID
jgi:hypothetical protein